MDPRDEDVDYLRDRIIIEEELRQQMEADYMEAEYYEQLPAKIEVIIQKKDENTTVAGEVSRDII
jgi:hypothetical protein